MVARWLSRIWGTTTTSTTSSRGTPIMGGAHRKVLITGASRGMGRALALEMARRGHTVIGCSRSQEKLDSLRADLHDSKHLLVNVDVKSDSSVQQLAHAVTEKKVIPDNIVNNAGVINKNNKLWEIPSEEFDNVIDTNVKGVANVLRHFIPLMAEKKQGIIVNVSSGWGKYADPEVAPYCASKFAVEGMTKSVSKELPPGIAIVALDPGIVNTDMLQLSYASTASTYPAPEKGAPKAATRILNLTAADNGASIKV